MLAPFGFEEETSFVVSPGKRGDALRFFPGLCGGGVGGCPASDRGGVVAEKNTDCGGRNV